METVVVALGSNLGDRLHYIKQASLFLESLSESPAVKSSIWESEPVGPAKYPFYNSVIKITTSLQPIPLLKKLKTFETEIGRTSTVRWGPRVIDLDIIRYGDLVIDTDSLIIPHPEYYKRRFVLHPMLEVDPYWTDPVLKQNVQQLTDAAPQMDIHKTDIQW
jgi:2-amino-4-hydroxy-6-hydroxymethyldihydropteridine diphosphokinase